MFKGTFILFFFLCLNSVSAQEGIQIGLEVSPAWDLNTHKGKVTTLWSAEYGYGFNLGVPVKWWFSEYTALQTGLTFEYMAFDNRFNNTLLSSYRYASLNLPLMFNKQLMGNWYGLFGAGINYHLINQYWVGYSVNISSQTNSFQPYLGLGINTLIERDKGIFEFGIQSRYHLIDLWAKGTPQSNDYSSKVLSFDLLLRFYLINK